MKTFLFTVSFCLVFGVFSVTDCVLSAAADEKAERFLFLINGMKFEREKLVSGVVRGKGERTLEREINGKSVSDTGQVEYFVAFDFLEDNQRVDRRELQFKDDGGYDRRLGQYIERKDAIEYCSFLLDEPQTGIIFVARPKEGDYDFHKNNHCGSLDPRNIGLSDLWRFTYGDTMTFSARMDSYKQRVPEVLVEEGNGIFRFEYHQRVEDRGELRKSILWIDSQNGFTLRRCQSIWEYDSHKDRPWILDDVRMSWKQVENVWIPVDVVFENNLPVKEKEKFVMSFDWESVNEPVAEEYFAYCNFETSEATPVVPVPRKNAKDKADNLGDFLNNCGTPEGRLLAKQIESERVSRRFWIRGTMMAVGLILIVFGIYSKYKNHR